MPSDMNKPPSRRGFLDWIVALGSLVTAFAVTVPGLMYLWPAAKGGGADKVEVEGADQMTRGQGKTIQVGSQAVVVVRGRNGFHAYSAVCTHLGCLVKWDQPSKQFHCPCHAAVFDENGKVVSGPPPAPLPEFVVKEIGDKVFVSAA